MRISRLLARITIAAALFFVAACFKTSAPTAPLPTPAEAPIANTYILPGAIDLGANAFGDDPIVIFKGERMRWRNLDTVEHNVVTDTMTLPEFGTTGLLAPGGEQSFVMNTVGETKIHCTIHPQMVGTLIVRER
ncbi:MAG TPA: plastocyanin/azurin family copper-binding protein [Vicinamibacterales bacterium]|nr:plastocyanin/azurin family copper-binding protein [Vicinamibacterales bacterium]